LASVAKVGPRLDQREMAQDVDRAMERRGDVLDVYTEPGRGQTGSELNWPGGVKMSNERGPFGGGMGKPVFGRGPNRC